MKVSKKKVAIKVTYPGRSVNQRVDKKNKGRWTKVMEVETTSKAKFEENEKIKKVQNENMYICT